MRSRYTRTALGPWWNVIGNAVLVGSLGLTFGVIMNQPLEEFLPYVAAGMAVWNCLQSLISDSPTVFTRNSGIISVYSLPLTLHVYRGVFDKLIMMGYALSIFAVMSIFFMRAPTLYLLELPFAMMVYFVFGVGCGLLLGVWGARYRDLHPAVQSLMTLAFLLTPVFWQKAALSNHPWIAHFNPLYHLLEIGRAPLLGHAAPLSSWIVSIAVALAVLLWGVIAFVTGRRTVLYWI